MKKISSSCLLGMSGGTDSSVSAILLKQQGYEVKGVTFRFFDGGNTEQHIKDARYIADNLGIEHFIYDARDLFKKEVIDYFLKEYLSGRTPVPCIKCNNYIKWKLLEELGEKNNCTKIATGHYCNLVKKDGFFHIATGIDNEKDQSFFLWGLQQRTLSKIILPLGNFTKSQVRKIASENGFHSIAKKKDSIGVCFCPGDYRNFIRSQRKYFHFEKGNFIDESGNVLGQHEGYPFYTVGQRRGLGIYLNRAIFVKKIIIETNTIVLAPLQNMYETIFYLNDWNLINESYFSNEFDIIAKIRYRKQATPARIFKTENYLLKVELAEPLESIAPGQACAFYKNNIVIGGGIIV